MKPVFNFDDFLTAVSAALSAKFPTWNVEELPESSRSIDKRSLFIDIEQFDCPDAVDNGAGQVQAEMNLHVYVVIPKEKGSKINVKRNALDVLLFGLFNRWGYNAAGCALPQGAFPDYFKQGAEEYDCMRVEFTHTILIGQSRLEETYDDTPPPNKVYVSEQSGPYEQKTEV